MNRKTLIISTAAALLGIQPCFAQGKDIEVAARTFKFIDGAPKGSATMGIVVDASVAESAAQGDALMSALGGGAVAGLTITPKIIAPGAADGVDLIFVTNGLGAAHGDIAAAAKAQGVMTFSTDMSCVEAQNCVMGVQSEPKVQIVVSRSASSAVGLTMNQALKMMVEERD